MGKDCLDCAICHNMQQDLKPKSLKPSTSLAKLSLFPRTKSPSPSVQSEHLSPTSLTAASLSNLSGSTRTPSQSSARSGRSSHSARSSITTIASSRQSGYSQTRGSALFPASLESELSSFEKEQDEQRRHALRRRLDKVSLAMEAIILALSSTLLGLSTAYAKQMLAAPSRAALLNGLDSGIQAGLNSNVSLVDPSTQHSKRSPLGDPNMIPSTMKQASSGEDIGTWAALYSGSMPVLSILFAILGLVLVFRRRITPVYTVVIAASFLAGWCVNLGWWVACDWGSAHPGANDHARSGGKFFRHLLIYRISG
jgi:hypothetical protein